MSLQEGSASQTGLPCSAVSTGPTQANMSLTVVKFTPMALPSALMLLHELGRGFDLPDQLVSAVLASHRGEGVDQTLDAGSDLVDLAAHIAEVVGQRVGPVRQPVEVIGVVADQGGAGGQPSRRRCPPDRWP